MKKLNNKGYMLVEIIIASVIAFSIAYYLLNLTIKFKNKNMDLYSMTTIETTKINITKNLMRELEFGAVGGFSIVCAQTNKTGICADNYIIDFILLKNFRNNYCTYGQCKPTRRRIQVSNKTIKYGYTVLTGTNKWDPKHYDFDTNDESYYQKKLDSTIEFKDASAIEENGIVRIDIPIKSIYTDEENTIKIVLERAYMLDVNTCIIDPTTNKCTTYSTGFPNPNTNKPEGALQILYELKMGKITKEARDHCAYLRYNTILNLNKIRIPNNTKDEFTPIFNDPTKALAQKITKDTILTCDFRTDGPYELKNCNVVTREHNNTPNSIASCF